MSCKIDYNIISTGSQGNAVLINNTVLIDCGVSFKELKPIYKLIKIVLLTHLHSDHFKKSTIKKLASERPTLRFACCNWMVDALLACDVPKHNIDVLECGKMYGYGICNIIPIPLVHNVPNCGYKVHFNYGKMIYATDTNNLNGISAKNYDLYMIEANHEESVIKQKIAEKKANGEYAYEMQAMKNHLSKEKCDEFIYKNIGANGTYVYMHCHTDNEVIPNDHNG